jgi:hypothetical protein
MRNWREDILAALVPEVNKLTLVADPDHLLSEEKLQISLKERGFDLLEYEGAIEFRYIYESQYRDLDSNELIVLVHQEWLNRLPFDIVQHSRHLHFNLGTLFPRLSYPIVENLDKRYFDKLYNVQENQNRNPMGDKMTMDFILRHIFEITIELIQDKVSLLKCLLRCHYSHMDIPGKLQSYLLQELRKNNEFRDWPLEAIIGDSESFYDFLQDEWPHYLDKINDGKAKERPVVPYRGEDSKKVPFGHDDILVYIDNLFVEGKLRPITMPGFVINRSDWARCGIKDEDNSERLERLYVLLAKELPGMESSYDIWLVYASKWANLSAMIHTDVNSDKRRYREFSNKLNTLFSDWLEKHYMSLANIPPMHTAMVHHIPRQLSRELEKDSNTKIALIVADGLAMDQWVSIRDILEEKRFDFLIRESASFACVPTLTSVSRQAVFSGKIPVYFSDSINTTSKEPKLWQQFWEDHGLTKMQIAYSKSLGKGDASVDLNDLIRPGRTKAIGLVINTVDDIMHGMELGAAGMHNQVKQWTEQGYLENMVDELLDRGFEVWLTADHGNIECQGKGRPSEGAIAETRGERARIYPTKELRDRVEHEFSFAKQWNSAALPSEYFPLIAEKDSAFIREGDIIVGHGGISIEEVIVPFIKFERRAE